MFVILLLIIRLVKHHGKLTKTLSSNQRHLELLGPSNYCDLNYRGFTVTEDKKYFNKTCQSVVVFLEKRLRYLINDYKTKLNDGGPLKLP